VNNSLSHKYTRRKRTNIQENRETKPKTKNNIITPASPQKQKEGTRQHKHSSRTRKKRNQTEENTSLANNKNVRPVKAAFICALTKVC
jgi:hypothetical protein